MILDLNKSQTYSIENMKLGMYLRYRWLLLRVKVMKSYSMGQSIRVQTLIQLLGYHDCPARDKEL